MSIPDILKELIPELAKQEDAYFVLNKALYGLKQAPREWPKMVKESYGSVGLKSSTADPNLFVGRGVYIPIFVDDKLIIGPRTTVDVVKKEIMQRWKCKDLGPVDLFVGFQIQRNRAKRSLKIHQEFYISKLLQRLKLENANPVRLLVPAGTVLKPDDDNLLEGDDITVYRQIVGSSWELFTRKATVRNSK